MALQPAGTGTQDRGFPFNARATSGIALLILTAFLVVFVSSAQAQRDHWTGTNFQASTSSGKVQLSGNLPAGTVGVAYSGAFIATGGVSPYSFRVVDGALPTGLSLNGTTGDVTGTPAASATKYFWVNVADSQGAGAKLHAQIVISAGSSTSVSVSISPSSATLASGGAQQFSAAVLGTTNTAVTWFASAGSITSGGLFTAPTVSTSTTVTVTATSAADPTKKASASVAVTASTTDINVSVSPASATVTSGNTQQFVATVQGTSYTGVTWSTTVGSISSSGLFTAPSVSTNTPVTVTATCTANTSKKANSSVTVTPGSTSTITVSISPTSASVSSGNTQQFAASVQGTSNTAVTWSATSGTISSGGMFTAPSVTSSSTVTITATSAADTTKKSSASVTVNPTQSAVGITTSSVPGAQSGSAYSFTLAANGGSLPYQWSIVSGSLPQGFTLSSTGQLSGTTTQTGTFAFVAQVLDAGNGTSSKSFSLSVSAPPPPPPTNAGYDGPAELPRVYIQTSLASTPVPGTTTLVSAGGNLQTALNNANCGDTIQLAAGATFSGIFTFPAKSCDSQHWIIVRTSAPDSSLPPEGTRISPCYAGVSSLPGRPSFNCSSPKNVMAKIVDSQGNNSGPVQFAAGANHYRLIGLEITRTAGLGINFQLVYSSGTANHIIIDRSWLHGSPRDDNKAGFSLSGMSYAALIDSYNTDFHCESISGTCTDAKVVGGGTSSTVDGAYKITNNFIEASGEGILFGGGGATTTPTDIEIRNNHFFKPMIWKPGQTGFVGGAIANNPFVVKNHLEIKNAQRVLIEGNIFENVWGGFSQSGYSLLLTPKNQASGTTNVCPICEDTDITIRYNTFSHMGGGISMADIPSDNGGIATAGERYSIHDITIDDMDSAFYVGSGRTFQILSAWPTNPLNNISINHVTAFSDLKGGIISLGNASSNPSMYAFTLKNSILGQALYPIWSTGGTTNCAYYDVPLPSLTACFTSYSFADNAIIATSAINFGPSKWPAGNYFPSTSGAVQFVNFNNGNGGDYHLLSTSPYKSAASDGKDIGADIDAIQAATAGVY